MKTAKTLLARARGRENAVALPQEEEEENDSNPALDANPQESSNTMNPQESVTHQDDRVTLDYTVLRTPTQLNHKQDSEEESLKEQGWLQTVAGVAGNLLEWYDFAVFGYFGDTIASVFFPHHQKGDAALIESFAVFGGAFLMRPVGGVVMGWIGDTYGRKKALELSIFLMAFPTFAMGCLPSYEMVGPVAILLLIVVRLLQGLSVGGQLVSSLVYTLEGHPHEKWGLYGSFVLAAANGGTLLGGFVGFSLRESLTQDQLASWGWRIPFWSGILVSLCGLYLRNACDDDEPFLHHHDHNPAETRNPLKEAFAPHNRRSLLAASLVPMLWSAGFYLLFVWMAIYMVDLSEEPVPNAFGVNSLSLLCSVCLLFPVAGILSDRCGRRLVMATGGVCLGIFCPYFVEVIGRCGSAHTAFVLQSILGMFLSLWGAPMCAWLVEAFAPQVRLTSVAIGYNVAQALVGGFTPFFATSLVDLLGPNSPGLLVTILSIVSVSGLWLVAPRHPSSQEHKPIPSQAMEEDPPASVQSTVPIEDEEESQEEYTNDDDESGLEII